MNKRIFITCLALALTASFPAGAAEKTVDADSRIALKVTIYNAGIGFVTEQRRAKLDAGGQMLAFPGLPKTLDPATVDLSGKGIGVTQRAFDADVLSERALLEHTLGKEVGVAITNPATGEETMKRARVLSLDKGLMLEMDGKVHVSAPGRLVFDTVPADVRLSPTLTVEVNAESQGTRDLTLSYLAGGLAWRADTTARIAADGQTLALETWATVSNGTGIDFRDAEVKLVAGEVRRSGGGPQLMKAMPMAARADMMESTAAPEQSFAAYHLYTVPGRMHLVTNGTLQRKLFDAAKVGFEEDYLFTGQAYAYQRRVATPTFENAEYRLVIDNKAANGLGRPLPAGTLRVYRADDQGDTQFAGEDAIGHIPSGEKLEVTLGRAFDVTARRVQTEFNRVSNRVTESAYEIELKNAKAKPVAVRLVEMLPGDWEMLRSSTPHDATAADRAEWRLTIPAKGEAVLSYSVRNRF